jgi:hypothetical protein
MIYIYIGDVITCDMQGHLGKVGVFKERCLTNFDIRVVNPKIRI